MIDPTRPTGVLLHWTKLQRINANMKIVGVELTFHFIIIPHLFFLFILKSHLHTELMIYLNTVTTSKKHTHAQKNNMNFVKLPELHLDNITYALIMRQIWMYVIRFDTKYDRKTIYEPPHGKTNNLSRRKQRRRSASR